MQNENSNILQQDSQQRQDFSTDVNPQGGSGPNSWNDQTQIVNEQDQNRPVNTGDPEYKENVTGRTQEPTPKDLNVSGGSDRDVSEDSSGAEIETPHRMEGNDEESTERKMPKM
jgi:hypothetical protein